MPYSKLFRPLLVSIIYLWFLVPNANAATPTIALNYEGKIRDRVGQNNLTRADGQSDGTFTVMVTAGGPLTLTQLRLTNNVGGVWDTLTSTANWTLGAANQIDSALVNGSDDSVSFTASAGNTFKIFASDLNNSQFAIGRVFTLTATFSDATTTTANVTISAIQTFSLTVASTKPASGTTITVTPSDNTVQGDGSTQFSRTYNQNTVVTLIAPSTAGGNAFNAWSGCDAAGTSGTTCSVTMTGNKTVTAGYTGSNNTLTVASINPSSGLAVIVSPNDLNNQNNGSTQFTRSYGPNAAVTLTAPATVGPNNFNGWTGCNSTSGTGGTTCNVTMSADKTVTAAYVVIPPAISVNYEGKIRDRVGQNNLTRADGQLDGAFTVTLTNGGPRTLTQLRMTNNVGAIYDTTGSTINWTLGVANQIDTALVNGNDDSINFLVNTGDSFKIFASDFNSTEFVNGRVFTLTATFSDATTASANVTINPVQTFTLTAASLNPASGASITVTPNDNTLQGNGSTQFSRTYNNTTAVALTASATAGGNNFSSWTGCDGTSGAGGITCNVTMTANKTVTANYAGSNHTLTVSSTNPSSGVSITVSPNDFNGQGSGPTQLLRTYGNNTAVTLTAPATAGANNFSAWTGCDTTSGSGGTICNVTMNADKTVAAGYIVTTPAISLNYEGRLRDRVGQNNLTRSDGQLDGTFTMTVTGGGSRTLTQLKLTNDIGGIWDTVPSTPNWTLGVASQIDSALLNAGDDSVNLTVNTGDSFKIFASDFNSTEFVTGRVFTLTATFSDTTTATANVPIGTVQTFALTVASSTPSSGASITVTPNDNNLQGNGSTQFVRTYNNNAAVSLTAPATAGGNPFGNWTGCDSTSGSGGITCNVTITANRTVTATYTGNNRVLTVTSTNPNSGVSITVSPNDKSGQGTGLTQLSRTYDLNTAVTLTAPATAGSNTFDHWTGCDTTSGTGGTICNISMTADKTVTAAYILVPPAILVTYEGKLRDRVGQNNLTRADGQLDGTFTMTVTAGGSRTLTQLRMTNNIGAIYDTTPSTANWTLGVANQIDSALLNAGDDSVNLTVNTGDSFKIFASDFNSTEFVTGRVFTLTATFSDTTTATANVTIGTVQSFALTVASSTPSSGAAITVSPNDNNLQGNGSTQFVRIYNNNSAVVLTAPAISGGNNFGSWTGCDSTSGAGGITCNVTITANRTVTATYAGNNRQLIIASSNPSSGVSITVSPNDKGGQGNGPTQLLRTYDLNTAVTITAPATVGTNNFNGWTGCDSTVGTTCNVTMSADKNVTVGYLSPNPLTITTDSLPTSMVSIKYPNGSSTPLTLTATGGTGNYTWSLAGGTSLPRGLSLSSNGTISGVPIELGTTKVSIQVSDGNSDPVVASYVITILTSPSDGCCNGFTKAFSGYWSFDDGTPFDDSGARSNGTPVNGPTVVPGKIGQALRFDGTSQYVDFGNVLDPGTGGLSVFAWVRTTQTTQPGGSNILISKFDSSGGFRLFQNFFGGLSFAFSNGSTTVRADSTAPQINDGNWHLVGAVFTRSGNGVIYVDGAPATNGSANISSMNGNFVGNTNNLRFALGDQTNQGLFWKGDIDEVSILTRRTLTDQEVADMYNPHPSIVSSSLPDGTVSVLYSQTLKGSGGTLPYAWSLAPGSTVPPGLQLFSDATIKGTPTTAGPYSFTVILDDPSNAPPATQTVNLTIRGTSKQLLKEDFTGDLTSWTHFDEPNTIQGPSNWYISSGPGDVIQKSEIQGGFAGDEDGVFPLDPAKPGTYLYYNGDTSTWQDYDLSLRLMAESIQAIGVMFRRIDKDNYYRFSMDYRRNYRMLVKVVNGQTTILALDHVPFEHGQSYDLRVAVSGSTIKVFLDNNLIPTFNVTDNSFTHGTVALYCWGDVNCHYGNVQVTCTSERDASCSAAH